MSSLRQKKVNELIRRELSKIIVREFEAPENSLVTITDVDTSPDLLSAKVSVSIFPISQARKTFGSLHKMAGFFQRLLNRRLKMKLIPRIDFYLIKNE
ncbi:30S ribosome-binding factor RbfA [bacterium]|nr:30S ribosome-binding factor RbfA [bacterium]